jgi:hypothetical protein
VLYACKGHGQTLPARVRTPSSPVRERERERGREIERERDSEKEGERERKRGHLFIKGMTGALAPLAVK